MFAGCSRGVYRHPECLQAVAAVCIAILNERGEIDYSQPVCHYWPEFAENGKHAVTVAQLISHQVNLPTPTSVCTSTSGWLKSLVFSY